MLKIDNVSKVYGNRVIFNKVSYEFSNKGLFEIRGRSGSGKSTLLRIISGVDKEYKGRIEKSDTPFFIPSDGYLVDDFSVKENILLNKDLGCNRCKYKDELDISSLLETKTKKLSKGERQRVGIYLAMNSDREMVLLDEPFAGVDDYYKKIIFSILCREARERLIIFSNHQESIRVKNTISIENAKLIGKYKKSKKEVHEVNGQNRLKKSLLWGLYVQYKSFISLLLLFISLIAIKEGIVKTGNEIENLKDAIPTTNKDEKLYYKESIIDELDETIFYDAVVTNLNEIIDNYYINTYDAKMYNQYVYVDGNKIGNGFLIANSISDERLLEGKVLLGLDKNSYCRENNYERCSDNIFESLKGQHLKIESSDFEILDIYESNKTELIFNSEDRKILLRDSNSYTNFIVEVDKENSYEFYNTISNTSYLSEFEFDCIDSSDDKLYFLVRKADTRYFMENEIKESYIVCSEIGVSCNALDYLKLNSLTSIDGEVVNARYTKTLDIRDYNTIGISSSLASKLNKEIDNTINLTFSINDTRYRLENVTIKNIYDSGDDTIYHAYYDYLLYKEKFDEPFRAKEILSEKKLNYHSRELLFSDVLDDLENYLEKIENIIKIVCAIFFIIMLVFLFLIEKKRLKKWNGLFDILTYNQTNSRYFLIGYIIPYFVLSLVFYKWINMLVIYLLFCFAFFIYCKNKIQIALD